MLFDFGVTLFEIWVGIFQFIKDLIPIHPVSSIFNCLQKIAQKKF